MSERERKKCVRERGEESEREKEVRCSPFLRFSLLSFFPFWSFFSSIVRSRAVAGGKASFPASNRRRDSKSSGITPLFTFKRLFTRAHGSPESAWQCDRPPPGCCHSIPCAVRPRRCSCIARARYRLDSPPCR